MNKGISCHETSLSALIVKPQVNAKGLAILRTQSDETLDGRFWERFDHILRFINMYLDRSGS